MLPPRIQSPQAIRPHGNGSLSVPFLSCLQHFPCNGPTPRSLAVLPVDSDYTFPHRARLLGFPTPILCTAFKLPTSKSRLPLEKEGREREEIAKKRTRQREDESTCREHTHRYKGKYGRREADAKYPSAWGDTVLSHHRPRNRLQKHQGTARQRGIRSNDVTTVCVRDSWETPRNQDCMRHERGA